MAPQALMAANDFQRAAVQVDMTFAAQPLGPNGVASQVSPSPVPSNG